MSTLADRLGASVASVSAGLHSGSKQAGACVAVAGAAAAQVVRILQELIQEEQQRHSHQLTLSIQRAFARVCCCCRRRGTAFSHDRLSGLGRPIREASCGRDVADAAASCQPGAESEPAEFAAQG